MNLPDSNEHRMKIDLFIKNVIQRYSALDILSISTQSKTSKTHLLDPINAKRLDFIMVFEQSRSIWSNRSIKETINDFFPQISSRTVKYLEKIKNPVNSEESLNLYLENCSNYLTQHNQNQTEKSCNLSSQQIQILTDSCLLFDLFRFKRTKWNICRVYFPQNLANKDPPSIIEKNNRHREDRHLGNHSRSIDGIYCQFLIAQIEGIKREFSKSFKLSHQASQQLIFTSDCYENIDEQQTFLTITTLIDQLEKKLLLVDEEFTPLFSHVIALSHKANSAIKTLRVKGKSNIHVAINRYLLFDVVGKALRLFFAFFNIQTLEKM